MILLLIGKVLFIFFSNLKMISARSKRRKILSLVFILKCISKKLLIRNNQIKNVKDASNKQDAATLKQVNEGVASIALQNRQYMTSLGQEKNSPRET